MKMGHQVRLMAGEYVKAFNIGNKKDAADARAIWLAVQQPGKPVAVKTEIQQAMLALHRMREQLVKFRTMQINSLSEELRERKAGLTGETQRRSSRLTRGRASKGCVGKRM
ncbi:hypothetical protein C7410_101315 [Paraburkholderia silvatlantica]|uniref:Transposase n=1 Tax=Paraburkholderia silvatlantica TaxID=321895 RepID=A0A2V4UBQ5_9BURK|nr:hypothetical protein C7410_101315 [Paraburkholderia silvatlantica]